MADFKRRTLLLSTGKQVKLFGTSMAIGNSLEVGECYAPNIFSYSEEELEGQKFPLVSNLHKLTLEEMMKVADYNIRLWIDLKDNIRKYRLNSIKVFNREALK